MKHFILLSFSLLSIIEVTSQTCDTLIVNDAYTSCFSKTLHEPIYVSYKLYKGGGECSRKSMKFCMDDVKETATSKDYSKSGYDKGHLANAADFSGDCVKEEKTFRFYNCVPQKPHLNRGIWKRYETEIRTLSQTDSLLIITGALFGNKKLPNSEVAIPDYCWKVVESLSTLQIYYSFIISNDDQCAYLQINVPELEHQLKYILPLKK